MDVLERMRSAIAAHGMADADTPVLLMVSGGSDSTALAYAACELAQAGELGMLAMLHVNHHLRGEDADADAAFVSQLADALAIPLFMCDIDVAGEVARTGGNVLYILLIGTVLSTYFSSMQVSLTRLMDHNEYDALLKSLVASFTNVNASVLPAAIGILALIVWVLRKDIVLLDVVALGRETAINLGVDYERVVRRLMVGVALAIAAATALVGPLSFLGLITANLAREMLTSHRHSQLIAASSLVGVVVLVAGQFLVEHLMTYSVPVSVFVTIGGGLYFLGLILAEIRRAR